MENIYLFINLWENFKVDSVFIMFLNKKMKQKKTESENCIYILFI